MRCQNFSNQRNVLFNEHNAFNSEILKMNENAIARVLLLDNTGFTIDMNLRIIIPSTHFINPFKSNVTFLYPLETSENLWFSDVFRGYRNVTLE